jgi:filamentous hemagglutinin family protein
MKNQRLVMLAGVVGITACTGIALAEPDGGDVTEGEAEIDYGDWTRVITGEITVIEWLSFQIAAGETVEFIMPSETSRVLNLINSGVPTEIMGTILGNGQVFLVNPSGVIFGQGAVVNVGALYAAAGNITTENFVNGVYRFSDARGVVENRGLLQGNLIALIGGRVANHGTISAPGGTVILAAGEQVLIGEHLGNVFVQLERPTDLANTDPLSEPGYDGVDLAAGDVFSLAAWNTGAIEGEHVTVAVSAGRLVADSSIEAGDITLSASGDSVIELGGDLSADGIGVFLEGDVILTGDVTLTSTDDAGAILFKGRVDSSAGGEHDLRVDAGGGLVRFKDSIGTGFEGARLGVLDVRASHVRLSGDVAVNQEMNFYAPVELDQPSTVFDVGMGSALFGDALYSRRDGASDVSFEYSGEAWVGTGEARTPFQFRDSIGVGPAGSSGGAFGHIRFGGDLSDPSRVSAFLFGTGAMAGLELMNAGSVDLGYGFLIQARDSIVMGRGQKMVSFGSLSLDASGPGSTLIEVGDLNVLGDLSIASRGEAGGVIHLLDRVGGEVDYSGNEADRDLAGLFDTGTELIASGSIVLDGELVFDSTVSLGGSSVQLLNNTGAGDGAGLEIGLFPGGVSIDLFRGMLSGTGDLLYPYDLAFVASGTDDSRAELATAFADDGRVRLRDDAPYMAARVVLFELMLNPRDPTARTIRAGIEDGGERFDESNAAAFGVTIDRLSQIGVERLTKAYIELLGDRIDERSILRVNDKRVMQSLGWLWLVTNGQAVDSLFGYAAEHDSDGLVVLMRVRAVLDAIELLELTPLEIDRAKHALLARIKPEAMAIEVLEGWFFPESSVGGSIR